MMAVNNAADDDIPLLAIRMEKKRQEDKKEEEEEQQQQQQHYLTWTTITKDPVYSEWMETLKSSTELGYRSGILAICRFYKVKPSDMRAWDSQTANDKLKQFVLYLKRNAKPYGGKRRSSGEFSVNSIPTYFEGTVSGQGSHIDLKIDSGSYVPVASPHTITRLPEGAHTIYLRSVDQDGHVDPTPAKWRFTVIDDNDD